MMRFDDIVTCYYHYYFTFVCLQKIDSIIDAKTRAVNEFDKLNVIKNQKYFGITPHPPIHHFNNELVSSLLNAKAKFVSSAVSSVLQSKLTHATGALGAALSGHKTHHQVYTTSGVTKPVVTTVTAVTPVVGAGAGVGVSLPSVASASFGTSAGVGGGSSGASVGASASLPGLASASFGAGAGIPLTAGGGAFSAGASIPGLAGASFGAGGSFPLFGAHLGANERIIGITHIK